MSAAVASKTKKYLANIMVKQVKWKGGEKKADLDEDVREASACRQQFLNFLTVVWNKFPDYFPTENPMAITCSNATTTDVLKALARHVALFLRHGLGFDDLVKLYDDHDTDSLAKIPFTTESKCLVINLLLCFIVFLCLCYAEIREEIYSQMVNRATKQKKRVQQRFTTARKKAEKVIDKSSTKRKRDLEEEVDAELLCDRVPSGGRRLLDVQRDNNADKENHVNSQLSSNARGKMNHINLSSSGSSGVKTTIPSNDNGRGGVKNTTPSNNNGCGGFRANLPVRSSSMDSSSTGSNSLGSNARHALANCGPRGSDDEGEHDSNDDDDDEGEEEEE